VPTVPSPSALPSPSHFLSGGQTQRTSQDGFRGFGNDPEAAAGPSGGGGRLSLGAFETSLPIRMDYEAMLAYLLLPPAGGVFLLLFEHKSDYVRYA
jgi:hypothetical protein